MVTQTPPIPRFSLPAQLGALAVSSLDKPVRKAMVKTGALLDGSALLEMDSIGEAWLRSLLGLSQHRQVPLKLAHFSPVLQESLSHLRQASLPPSASPSGEHWLEKLGIAGLHLKTELTQMLYLLTESIYWSTLGCFDPHRLPFRGAVTLQLIRLGSTATSIVFLLTFLVGLTLAFQSAIQLDMLGAGIYLVRGVVFSMFMEIGPLITAIILAGRSGSAITAEISSMVVQEEVKALRTMGVHPTQYLVLPRFQAMSIAVPLLTMLANIAGCFAGYLVAVLYTDLPTPVFLSEFREALPLSLIGKSLIKGLVFGWIITLVSTTKGLRVHGGAEAVGRATTQCVVFSISAIILADAIFSFIFY